jgi:hypothetical protein
MSCPTFALIASMLLAASLGAQERKKSENESLPGQAWTYEATKGEITRKGEFRTHEKKVFIAEKNIGTVTAKGDETTLVVRGNPILNGRIVLKRDGDVWRGSNQHQDGSRWSIVVRLKEAKPKEKPERKKPK